MAHPKVTAAVKKRLRDQYRSLDPVGLLAEIRATQDELGNRVDRRARQARGLQPAYTSTAPAIAATFAKTLGRTASVGETLVEHVDDVTLGIAGAGLDAQFLQGCKVRSPSGSAKRSGSARP